MKRDYHEVFRTTFVCFGLCVSFSFFYVRAGGHNRPF